MQLVVPAALVRGLRRQASPASCSSLAWTLRLKATFQLAPHRIEATAKLPAFTSLQRTVTPYTPCECTLARHDSRAARKERIVGEGSNTALQRHKRGAELSTRKRHAAHRCGRPTQGGSVGTHRIMFATSALVNAENAPAPWRCCSTTSG